MIKGTTQTMYTTKKEKILEALNDASDCVLSTYGPNGSLVYIRDNYVTKDGVTVVNALSPKDYYEKIAVNMMNEAVNKTLKTAGDGTTTTCLFLKEFSKEHISDFAIQEAISQLLENSSQDIKVFDIALTASNNDKKIATLLSEIYEALGNNVNVVLKQSDENKLDYELTKGASFDVTPMSPLFLKNEQNKLESPLILVCDFKFKEFKEIYEIVKYAKLNNRDLVIFCREMIGECMETSLKNFLQGVINMSVLQIPFSEHKIEQICNLTGAKYLRSVNDKLVPEYLGESESVIVTNFFTSIINTKQDTSALAVVNVGGTTEIEMKEMYDRMDDAVNAVRNSFKYGVCDGGGRAFLKINTSCEKLNNILKIPASYFPDTKATDATYTLIEALKNANSVASKFTNTKYFIS